ncbi:MAG: acetoacetate decarboxylase family protein [Polyangiales bacterium]|nr:acetoacetate decarboxylase family protein [Myxococcales bacterium]MCB9661260.1 acetoacetate decarboxylase family protein [Sandaracinaceae bacterium]
MKSTKTIEPQLLDNQDRFQHPFFKEFTLREGPRAIQLPGDIQKSYKFPTFYGDVTCSVAVFMCDYARAQALLPDPRMAPIRMPRGRAALTISNYVYRNVGGIPGYNEVAMTLPVLLDGKKAPPVVPLITPNPNKGYYVFAMPVTSLENKVRGDEFWGLPKTVQDIDIDVQDGRCTTRATDDDGKLFFELSVPTSGKPKHMREVGTVCSMLEGKLARSYTTFEGDFHLNTRFGALLSRGVTVNEGATDGIVLGDSPHADVLRQLELEAHPFQTRFVQSMNACFDLPYRVALAPTP